MFVFSISQCGQSSKAVGGATHFFSEEELQKKSFFSSGANIGFRKINTRQCHWTTSEQFLLGSFVFSVCFSSCETQNDTKGGRYVQRHHGTEQEAKLNSPSWQFKVQLGSVTSVFILRHVVVTLNDHVKLLFHSAPFTQNSRHLFCVNFKL